MSPQYDHVLYEPWVGQHWEDDPAGKRIFVVGESHFSDPPCWDTDFTQSVIDMYLSDSEDLKPQHRTFWTKLTSLLSGKGRYETDKDSWRQFKESFWHSIAYCVFVQEPLAAPGSRPTPEMWEKGELAFREELADLKPTHVVLVGRGL
jgi:hypothetical protein